MKKPLMKRKTAVEAVYNNNLIVFYAPPYVAQEMGEYGFVNNVSGECWHLYVDPRYDVNEVVRYITEYDA